MERKEKLFFVILLSLSLSAILTNVFGQTTYTCKVKDGDEYIFTCTKLEERFLGISGSGLWDVNAVGDKIKVKITDIRETERVFYIDYDRWEPISEGELFGAVSELTGTHDLYNDPSNSHLLIKFIALTPVSNYLAEYAETNTGLYGIYGVLSSSENVLTERRLIYGEYWEVVIEFDSNGIASKIQFSIDATVLYVLTRTGLEIPGYDLLMLIGLTAITGVIIIYIVKKKVLKSEAQVNF